MKCFITGGAGFVGTNLAMASIERNDKVIIFDSLFRSNSVHNLEHVMQQSNVEFIHGDIRNRYDITAAVKQAKPDVVFHLAGQVAMTTSLESPYKDFEINAVGTLNVLEAIRQYAPQVPVLYSSTNKVYGDLESLQYAEGETRYEYVDYPSGLPEDMPLDFSTPYGCSKGSADSYMIDYHRTFGTKTVVFRHSTMYGARQFPTFDQGWIVLQALKTKEDSQHTFTVSGNGKQVRDLLHAKDVIALYYHVVENIEKTQGQAFNVGGGMENAMSILELLTTLSKTLSVGLSPQYLEPRLHDQKVFIADTTKLNNLIGWKPRVSKEEGINDMITWLGEQR